jgi:hypothetical protein
MRVYVGLIAASTVVQVSLLLIGQQGLVDFFRYRPLLLIVWGIFSVFTPTPEENDQYIAHHSNHMDRQARISDTLIVQSRERRTGEAKHCHGGWGKEG